MGGRALKTVQTVRKTKDEYQAIKKAMESLIGKIAPRHAVIPACEDKQTFGDIDCLIVPYPSDNLGVEIQRVFQPREIVHNGDCWSFDLDNFQVDLIPIKPELFDTAFAYMAYGELGNIMGRIARGLGLKYGHKGLWLPVTNNKTNKIGEIILTTKPEEIFQFLGYDHQQWKQGFQTMEALFSFSASSPHFNPKAFQLEKLDCINRKRMQQRPNYLRFLEWLDKKYRDIPPHPKPDKTIIQNQALLTFGKTGDYNRLIQQDTQQTALKSKLTSAITALRETEPHLQGQILGKFIAGFKNQWPDKTALDAWLETSTPEEIKNHLQTAWQQRVQNTTAQP
jgi:hypothetical protein